MKRQDAQPHQIKAGAKAKRPTTPKTSLAWQLRRRQVSPPTTIGTVVRVRRGSYPLTWPLPVGEELDHRRRRGRRAEGSTTSATVASVLLASLVLLAAHGTPARAQAPAELVRDINTQLVPFDLDPVGIVPVGDGVFFVANQLTLGQELWRSDGTAAGTVLVKDIYPGLGSSYPFFYLRLAPQKPLSVGDTWLFAADDGTHGRELWRSDGTSAGTVLVEDIAHGDRSSYPVYLTDVNGTLLFTADDGTSGTELWRSDGTSEGTVLVKDINPGDRSSSPHYVADVNGTLFFTADDGTSGIELWRSDGTSEGTVLVKDIAPGSGSPFGYYSYGDWLFSELAEADGTLFFLADDGTHGVELWRSDGTEEGTALVRDIVPGDGSPFLVGYEEDEYGRETYAIFHTELAEVNGTLFFVTGSWSSGYQLWRSDGTESGTIMVKDFAPGGTSYPRLAVVDGILFVVADDGTHGVELWRSDGTEEGTALVEDIAPGDGSSHPGVLTNVNGTLFFTADDGTSGRELWRSDGTPEGTVLVKDIAPGDGSSNPGGLTNVNGTLFFTADDGTHGRELWRSDGTSAGTVLVKDMNPGAGSCSFYVYLTNVNGTLFFTACDGPSPANRALWRSDGTEPGTFVVKEPESVGVSSDLGGLTNVDGTLFFTADDGTSGRELWRSDGTSEGTVLVEDIAPGEGSSDLLWLTNVDGTLFFPANDYGTYGRELWRSDGTPEGTVLVKDINPGAESSFGYDDSDLAVVDDTLFFLTGDSRFDRSLWRSDGTEAGTVLIKDFFYPPRSFTNVDGTLFFSVDRSLWRSDGTEAGTVVVKDFAFHPRPLTNVDGTLFFAADAGVPQGLWRSDGTESGTILVKDIAPVDYSSFGHSSLAVVEGIAFFAAYDGLSGIELGLSGIELWRSDGTSEGTVMVKDINPGAGSSLKGGTLDLAVVDGILFFPADDGVSGRELWRSDGTESGTVLVRDIAPGDHSSFPSYLTDVNGKLVFTACDPTGGCEVWVSDGSAAGTQRLADVVSGSGSSNPSGYTISGPDLFFTATTPREGGELWKIPRIVTCGDGFPDPEEECDDGNLVSGDACDADCTVTACGNGIVTDGEECDDGNQSDADACKSDCTENVCGDGARYPLYEACDDGNQQDDDACSNTCRINGAPVPCHGDCDESGAVSVGDLVVMVNVALGLQPAAACTRGDLDDSGSIAINEIIIAVKAALRGCTNVAETSVAHGPEVSAVAR